MPPRAHFLVFASFCKYFIYLHVIFISHHIQIKFMFQMLYYNFEAQILNLKLCTAYSSSAAVISTGPTETTTFGSTCGSSLLWSTAPTSLTENRHTNMVRFKWTLIMNSADYILISYLSQSMMAQWSVQVQRGTQLYCSECTPEQGKQCWQGNTEIFYSSSL